MGVDKPGERATVGFLAQMPRGEPTELALGHEIVRLVDEGLLKDLADAADLLGFTRARVTQIVDLTLLAPDIQEALLFGDGGVGQAEHRLRAVVAAGDWQEQRARLDRNRPA